MQQKGPIESGVADHPAYDLAIERTHRPLLLVLLGPRSELLRRDLRQHVNIAAAEMRVPRRRPASRHDDDSLRRHRCLVEGPRHEWNPVEQLEPDLTRPRADEHRPTAARQRSETPGDSPLFDPKLLLPFRISQSLREHLVLSR